MARGLVCGFLLVLSNPMAATAQSSPISGIVVSARTGGPIAGAIVIVDGTSRRVRTHLDGRFTLQASHGFPLTLTVQAVGHRPLIERVSGGTGELRIALPETAIELDAVLVTGTPGGTEARAVGHAVASIPVPEVLAATPVMDLQHVFHARVPGLFLMPYQGNVGTGARTRMRGVSSLTLPNEPLIYIDGIRVDNNPRAGPDIRNRRQVARINDISAEDIERVEVVKGPAASSLYGTEASHGVIQIFTRRGIEGPLRLTFSAKQGRNWFVDPSGRLPIVWDSSIGLNLHDREVAAGRPIFQTGPVQAVGLTASGGTATTRYYLSGNIDRDEGMVWYNWRRRASARANLDFTHDEHWMVQGSVGVIRNSMRLAGPAQTYDLMTQLVWGDPAKRESSARGFRDVPPEVSATIDSRAELTRFIGSLHMRHTPNAWLSQRLTLGADVGDETSSRLFPRHPDGIGGPFGTLSLGDLTVDQWNVRYATVDYLAAANYGLASGLTATTSVGAQYVARQVHAIAAHGAGLPPGGSSLSGAANTDVSEERVGNKAAGIYAQQQIGWNRRLFVTAALRADDHSAFGPDFDFVTYPNINATWIVSEKPFRPRSVVHDLKLRAAWGRAGQQPEAFAATPSYRSIPGPGDAPVLTPFNIGNPGLGPERGSELELGFDAGVLADRVAVSFTYYRQHVVDAIASRVLAPSAGFSGAQFINVGRTSNRGFEVAIRATILAGPSIAWDLGFSFATNHNRVESLGGIPAITLASLHPDIPAYDSQFHQEGFPLGSYFMPEVVAAYVDSTGTFVMECAGGPDLGRAIRDSIVPCNRNTPRVYAGQPTPTWDGAIRTGVTLFGRLRIHGLVDFRGGHVMTNLDAGFAHRTARNTLAIVTGSDPVLKAYDQMVDSGSTGANRRMGFMNGGFVKLREFSATYTFPREWSQRLGVSQTAITVASRNLAMLWRAQPSVYGVRIADPEVGFPEDLNGRVQNALPQYAQFLTAIRIIL